MDDAAIGAKLEQQPRQLTPDQMERIERAVSDAVQDDGIVRRVGLATLTISGHDMIESILQDREAAVALAESERCIRDYAKRLKKLASLMDSAATRLLIAGCFREDCEAIRREAA
jgi:hypothetical protein